MPCPSGRLLHLQALPAQEILPWEAHIFRIFHNNTAVYQIGSCFRQPGKGILHDLGRQLLLIIGYKPGNRCDSGFPALIQDVGGLFCIPGSAGAGSSDQGIQLGTAEKAAVLPVFTGRN